MTEATEAGPSSPEEIPLQEAAKRAERLLRNDSTANEKVIKSRESGMAFPDNAAGFY
jgi:hypothetical protein